MTKILFLDYDGVLHPFDVYATGGGGEPELHCDDKSLKLFCWAPTLESILDDIDPQGSIQIVLSTTWAQKTHWTSARNYLPEFLRSRVIGGTHPALVPRGVQIELYVVDYRIPDGCWIAIDDDDYRWPAQHLDKLVICNPDVGLSNEKTQQELRQKLERLMR